MNYLKSLKPLFVLLALIFAVSYPAISQTSDTPEETEAIRQLNEEEADTALQDTLGHTEEAIVPAPQQPASARETARAAQPTTTTPYTEEMGDPFINILVLGIILLLLIIIVLAVNIFKMVMQLNDMKVAERPEFDWNKWNPRLMLVFLLAGFIYIGYQTVIYYEFLLPEAASVHGRTLDTLFYVTLIITAIVFVITQILLFYFSYQYGNRKRTGKAFFFPENHKLEIFWTAVPFVVLTVLILYGFKAWQDITTDYIGDEAPHEIEVFGEQFRWYARYPGPDGILGRTDFRLISPQNPLGLDFTDTTALDDIITGELYLPENREVLMRFRSRDVLHSAHFPHFRAQMYVVPGMPTQFKFTPTITTREMRQKTGNDNFNYELACNQICGNAHFNMRMLVHVEDEVGYDAWLAGQSPYYDRIAPAQTQVQETEQEQETELPLDENTVNGTNENSADTVTNNGIQN